MKSEVEKLKKKQNKIRKFNPLLLHLATILMFIVLLITLFTVKDPSVLTPSIIVFSIVANVIGIFHIKQQKVNLEILEKLEYLEEEINKK